MKSIYKIAFAVLTVIIFQNISAQSNTKYSITAKPLELKYSKSTPEAFRLIVENIDPSQQAEIFERIRLMEKNHKILVTHEQFEEEIKKSYHLKQNGSADLARLKNFVDKVEHTYLVAEEFISKIKKKK